MSGFAGNIADPKKQKHTLLVIRPRVRLTGWTSMGSDVYRAPFALGYVTRAWMVFDNETGLINSGDASPTSGEFWYDHENQYIYVHSSPDDPDDLDYPGVTIEFELHLSDQTFVGPRDPLSAGSQKVTWRGCIQSSPFAQIGSRESIFGFAPMNSSMIDIINDGWMNEFLYGASFNRCPVKGYVLANEDLTSGAVYSEVKEIFRGFTSGMRSNDGTVSITCTDFISFLEKRFDIRTVDMLVGVSLDPRSENTGQEWMLPIIFGMLDRHRPINIDYNSIASETNNRDWVTHQRDFDSAGAAKDDGTLSYVVDHAAANTTTRTYFTTTPKVRIDDNMVIQRAGVDKYVLITDVNEGAKYVDHIADAIGTSVNPGDTATRYFVAGVQLKDPAGIVRYLKPGRDYTMLVDDSNNVRGFVLNDNLETTSGFGNVFDPADWTISCRVYGSKTLEVYSDASTVGELKSRGGVASMAITAIYRLLRLAGMQESEIAESTFQAVDDDSYSIGLSIPADRDARQPPTFREVITKLLTSNLYKIAVMEEGSTLKMGIVAVQPFPANDYSADELNMGALEFEHDYSMAASEVRVKYRRFEAMDTDLDGLGLLEYAAILATSPVAANLHLIAAGQEVETYLTDEIEATELAAHFAFILGDRRGLWTTKLELPYVDKTNLGAVYELTRQQMPGFAYTEGTQRARDLVVAEVNKNSAGVTITFEDQKGIQDNSADW